MAKVWQGYGNWAVITPLPLAEDMPKICRRYAEDKPTLSKHEGKDCALFVATNEADATIV